MRLALDVIRDHGTARKHEVVGIGRVLGIEEAIRKHHVGPIASDSISGAVELVTDLVRLTKSLAHLSPILFHIAEIDVLNEVLSVRMMLLLPPDNLDDLSEAFAIFPIETGPRILLRTFGTLVIGAVWKRAELGMIIAHRGGTEQP